MCSEYGHSHCWTVDLRMVMSQRVEPSDHSAGVRLAIHCDSTSQYFGSLCRKPLRQRIALPSLCRTYCLLVGWYSADLFLSLLHFGMWSKVHRWKIEAGLDFCCGRESSSHRRPLKPRLG